MIKSLANNRLVRVALLWQVVVLCSGQAEAQTYTLTPTAYQTVVDSNGNPISGACVWTYSAGTTTAAATYTTSSGTANTNPIQTDSAGRFVAFLAPGASYKFVYEDATCTLVPPVHGAVIKTVDNIAAVPASAANLDITGTAGEALTAGKCAYLSDGSGSKTQGSWYLCDSTLAYSSVIPQIGMVPASISNGASGTIRLAGQMTGLTVSAGSDYYISTSGSITSTAPTLARKIGQADSTSTLIIGTPSVPTEAWANDFRLTLTTATPVTTANVTAATTIYCTPMTGNRIDLPDSTGNPIRLTSAEFSIAVPATTVTMYDIFAYNNAGVATLELLAWTNDTTRATAIIRTAAGRYYKSGDLTRMYLGSFRTTGSSGQTEDSLTKRFLYNYYNRAPRSMLKQESTASWTYTTATIRQANGAAGNQVEFVIGVADQAVRLEVSSWATNSSGNILAASYVGLDSTSAAASGSVGGVTNMSSSNALTMDSWVLAYPAVGYHYAAWLEVSQATGTTTWVGVGTSAIAAYITSNPGINGVIMQ